MFCPAYRHVDLYRSHPHAPVLLNIHWYPDISYHHPHPEQPIRIGHQPLQNDRKFSNDRPHNVAINNASAPQLKKLVRTASSQQKNDH